MEAILLTGGLLVVMLAALLILAKTWPRSSRRTGFRLDHPDDARSHPVRQEDDEVHFRFPEPGGGTGSGGR